ncbi:MAG TPA: hypothetical protein VMA83_09105 [Solirubrobacteraceae bacterium]|nr:hypothetical protein [Solirubrobacteraceae bacterium]
MKRIKIMGLAVVAIFAFAALTASAASAKTLITLSDESGTLTAGETIVAESTNLKTYTEAGILECENNVLPTKLSGNGEAKVKGSTTEEKSFGEFDGIPGACKTSVGIPTEIQTTAFPWSSEMKVSKGAGEQTEKGTKKVTFIAEYLYPELGEKNKCEFEASKVVSAFAVGATPQPLVLETKEQEFKLNTKYHNTASICPKTGLLSGTWSVKDGSETVNVAD